VLKVDGRWWFTELQALSALGMQHVVLKELGEGDREERSKQIDYVIRAFIDFYDGATWNGAIQVGGAHYRKVNGTEVWTESGAVKMMIFLYCDAKDGELPGKPARLALAETHAMFRRKGSRGGGGQREPKPQQVKKAPLEVWKPLQTAEVSK
jgi:hypothetical protein